MVRGRGRRLGVAARRRAALEKGTARLFCVQYFGLPALLSSGSASALHRHFACLLSPLHALSVHFCIRLSPCHASSARWDARQLSSTQRRRIRLLQLLQLCLLQVAVRVRVLAIALLRFSTGSTSWRNAPDRPQGWGREQLECGEVEEKRCKQR